MSSEWEIKNDIIKAGKKLSEHFFVASNDGNISARLNEKELLITPTSVNKGDMTSDQIIRVDMQGNVISGSMKPSSEIKMHLAVYRKRPDVWAIVHAHPPVSTGFAACGMRLDEDIILPEVIFGLGRIGFAEYGTPSTDEIPRSVEKEIDDCDAMLLENHGAITVGETVMQAYYRMEVLEMFSRVNLVTRLLGGARVLSEEQVDRLFSIKEQRGWGKNLRKNNETAINKETLDYITKAVLEKLKVKGLDI